MTLQEYLYEDYIKTNILPNLSTSINEDNDKDNESIKQKVIDYINTLDSDIFDNISILKNIKSYLNKKEYFNHIKNMNKNKKYDEENDIIKKWVKEKLGKDKLVDHINDFYDAILDAANQTNFDSILIFIYSQYVGKGFINVDWNNFTLDQIKKYYNDEDYYNDIKSIDFKSEINIELDKDNWQIEDKFWDILIRKMSATQPVIGKGELVLKTISKMPSKDTTGLSDIQIGDKGCEVKYIANHEAYVGNDRYGGSKLIYKLWLDENETSKQPNIGVDSIGDSYWKNVCDKIFNNDIIKDIKDEDKIIDVLSSNLNDNINKLYARDGKTLNGNNVGICKLFFEKLWKVKNNLKTNKELFVRLCTILYMILYSRFEKFDNYIFIINGENGNEFKCIEISGHGDDKNTFNYLLSMELPLYQLRYDKNVLNIGLKKWR